MINENTSGVRIKALEAIIAAAVLLMAATVLLTSVVADGDGLIIIDDDEQDKFYWEGYYFEIVSEEDCTAKITGYYGDDETVTILSTVQHDYMIYDVVAIGNYAFAFCDMKSAVIPDGVTEIGSGAFKYCGNLTDVVIPSSITTIGDDAFAYCDSITSFEIPSTVTKIGKGLFYMDANLSYAKIPMSIGEIPASTFCYCSALEEFDIPAVSSIGDWAFSNTSLKSVIFPDTIRSIGNYVFEETLLTHVSMPAYLESIGDGAFYNCYYLVNVDLNEGLKTIGDEAFYGCRALCSVSFPDTVSEVGDVAFSGCIALRSVTMGANTPYRYDMFASCPVVLFSVTKKCSIYTAVDGILYSADMSKLIAYPAAKSDESFAVPAQVRVIGEGAFYSSINLVSVSGKNVTDVEAGAFMDCMYLADIDFPKLQKIGDNAFTGCVSLSMYTIPAGVNSIGPAAFALTGITSFSVAEGNQYYAAKDGVLYDVDMMTLVEFPNRSVETFVIPDGVVEIGKGAFFMTGIQEVVFSPSVETIGEAAFGYCALKTVTIPSTVKYIGDMAFALEFNLEKVTIEATNPELGTDVFGYCLMLSEVVFADGVTAIGEGEFEFDFSLKKIILPESVGVIMSNSFNYTSLEYIYIPRGAVVFEDAFGWMHFVDEEGNDLAYNELAGYAYKANDWGYMERQAYSLVSFDVNGGSEAAPESVVVANGFTVTLPEYKGVKADYEFSGWFWNNKAYAVGEEVTVESDMEFVAIWYKDVVTVSFDITGGKADVDSLKVEIGSTYKTEGNVMTITNGTLTNTVRIVGDYSSTAVVVWESASGMIIEDSVFKAAFPQYGITLLCDETQGKVSGPATAFEGQTVTLAAEPFKGYALKEWIENERLVTVKDNQFVMPASDVTIAGIFTAPSPLTIKSATGGKAVADCDIAVAGTVVTLKAYENTDYNFKSWSVSPSSVVVKDNKFVMPDSNVTITPLFSFAGTKTVEVANGKAVFTADKDIKEDTKITLSITKVKNPKQSNIPSDALVYSIKATAENAGKTVDLTDKKVTVTIYVESKDAQKKVYFVSDDGKTVENMYASYDIIDGGLVFSTTHFSDFVITEKNIDPVKDKSTMMYIIIAAIILIIIIAVILIAWRAKMNRARP